ncbi:MAG: hypothetical protein GEU88_17125 [Solirubrobacterales bacterium]|nr:hypothetical protein [Solirubrobacterales bacterium]
MIVRAQIVDLDALWKTVVAAMAAGVGITLAFSVALLGWVRATDSTRERPGLATAAWAAVCVIGLLALAAAVVVGLIVMTDK